MHVVSAASVMVTESMIPRCSHRPLCFLSGELPHHRIFWREETTSSSLWEGVHQALMASKTDRKHDKSGGKEEKGRHRGSTACLLREISQRSDLRRLSDLLAEGTIDITCPKTLTEVLQTNNPAVVDMVLQHGKHHGYGGMAEFLGSFGDAVSCARLQLSVLPLHTCCHVGSPETVSVLLRFMVSNFSPWRLKTALNTRDLNGRTALHLASWSPQPHCAGRRHFIMRSVGGSFDVLQSVPKSEPFEVPYSSWLRRVPFLFV